MKTGIELIAIERQEQIEKHHRTIAQDKELNADKQLSFAAKILISNSRIEQEASCPKGWDLTLFRKMINKGYKERLIIAGALIAAEIDRINAEGLIVQPH